MSTPTGPVNEGEWSPVVPGWTPCEDRPEPDAWVDVDDEPYDGPYHDPEAPRADAD